MTPINANDPVILFIHFFMFFILFSRYLFYLFIKDIDFKLK